MIPKKSSAVRISHLSLEEVEETQNNPPESPKIPINLEKFSQELPQESFEEFPQESDHSPRNAYDLPQEEYHHPQIIDQDVQNFTTRLDTMIAQFRNESLKEFMALKRSLLHEQVTTIESEKKKCNAQLSAKQDQVEHLKEELAQAKTTIKTCTQHKEGLALMVGTLRAKAKAQKLSSKAFMGWFKFHENAQIEKKLGRVAKVKSKENCMKGVFSAWKSKWRVFHDQKEAQKRREFIEAEKKELSMYYNKEIETLTRRVQDAEFRLTEEQANKESLQENLKNAFMRGICAMNFEAMNLMNPSTVVDQIALGQDPLKQASESETTEVTQEETKREEINPLDDIYNKVPAESKDHMWKPAPVYGVKQNQERPQTAPEQTLLPSSIPSNLQKNSGEVTGKTIIVNASKKPEPKVKGRVPIKTPARKHK